MKYPINLLRIVSALLFSFNIILLLIIRTERKKYFNLKLSFITCNDSIKQFKDRSNILLLNTSLMFEYQSKRIDGNIIFLNEEDDIISIKQLAMNSPKLIFKYSALNCNVCIDEQISLLKKASKDIGSENIIIITDYDTPRELSQFIRMNQINFRVLNLQNMEFTLIDKSLPYYFILDESFSLKLLFIPIKGDTSLTQQYFNKISERYFH
ncbi:MAG: redoxin domain-containing protein [Bacteroidia bacterium]|nr:redoxin domain-containing protein [Bacteroidia bacterium]